jgi:transcription elongation factor Elf1
VPITKERAERIAKAHGCVVCGEYTYKKLTVRTASAAVRDETGAVWQAVKVCGVCGAEQEMGLDEDGDVVYGG